MMTTKNLRYLIGVDIGGTFTDCVVIDSAGKTSLGKVSSTPPNFNEGFVGSLAETAACMGMKLEDLISQADGIYHGCTIGTNALVENRTARVGLLTTAGHRDSFFIMQGGARLIGLEPRQVAHVAGQSKQEPLVPKHLVEEIDERIGFDGNVVVELNEERCRESIQRLLDAGVEAFAVSCLWSIVNPEHEHAIARIIHEVAPDAFVSVSSEVVTRQGEYQRTVATVINALIGPVTSEYLRKLENELAGLGYKGKLYIMSCTGGLIDSGQARELPLLTIGSGPVAGLIGAGNLAYASGSSEAANTSGANILTADMGGTTFDVGLIRHGQAMSRPTTRHGQYEYFVPTLDIRSVGSGGGSIVHFDTETGSLRVGPQSAAAVPGPASYLRGGTEATVTDADLVLGYLNPKYFLGGRLELSAEAARNALVSAGAPLGFDTEQTAAAAARIVDNQMADAIRLASVQQGYDPREFTMYAYGGAGAVHGPAVAAQLGIRTVVIPLGDLASGWSAFGVTSSDALVVQEVSVVFEAPFDPEKMNLEWSKLEAVVAAKLKEQGIKNSDTTWQRTVDIRHSLQVNEVRVSAPPGKYDAATSSLLAQSFSSEYERLYGEGSGYADAGLTLTGMCVSARAKITDFQFGHADDDGETSQIEPKVQSHRQVIWYEHGLKPVRTPVYDGKSVVVGSELNGPAIVEFVDTTLVLRHGQTASVDPLGNIVVKT